MLLFRFCRSKLKIILLTKLIIQLHDWTTILYFAAYLTYSLKIVNCHLINGIIMVRKYKQ